MRKIAVAILVLSLAFVLNAQSPQRKVEPVKPSTNKTLTPPRGTDEKIIQTYLSGDTAKAKSEARKDSLRKAYPRYPNLTDVTFSFGLSDLLLPLFGQKYAGVEAGVSFNLWNRIQPAAELGVGWSKNTPDGMNFTYRGKVSPYLKIGANYNFLFKNEPRYQLLAMLRLGMSTFRYDVTDVTVANGYWQESSQFDIKGESSHAIWGEIGAGIKVGLTKQFSMGWAVKYHGLFNYKKNAESVPWHIPGYGPRSGHWAFSMALHYVLPRNVSKWPNAKKDQQPHDEQPVKTDGETHTMPTEANHEL